MNIEEGYQIVGQCGRYQFFLLFLLSFQNFFVPMQMVLMVIVGATPNPDVRVEQNLTTIVTDFHLENEPWIIDLIQSLFMVGYMVGCTVNGQLSDIYGRKNILLPCFTAIGVLNILSGLTDNWKTFLVTRFFAGFFVGGCAIAFTLARELLGAKVWNWAGMIYHVTFSFGMGVLAGLSMWLQDWRLICYVTGGLTCLLSFSFYFFIIDSPRWLHSVGKSEKASQLLQTMAKKNGRNIEGIDWSLSQSEEKKSSTLVDLFRHKTLIFWLILGAFVWATAALIYYGLTLSVSEMTSNLFLGTALSGLVEVPASLLSVFLLNSPKFGKKRTAMFTFTVCLVGLIGMAARPEGPSWWRLLFGLTAKLAIAATFNVLFLYCIEIFPTTMRTASLGFSSTTGRIGAIVAPFINLTDTTEPRLPYIIYAVTCGLSIIAIIFLPSTESCPLPETVEEALSRKSSNNQNKNDDEAALINSEFES